MHQQLHTPDQVLPDAAPAAPDAPDAPDVAASPDSSDPAPVSSSDPAAPTSPDSTPLRRKSVSLAPRPNAPLHHSAAHDKLVARKPTPFNTDLAETIKNAGINAALLDNIDDLDEDELERLDNQSLDEPLPSPSDPLSSVNGKHPVDPPVSDAQAARPQGPNS